MAENKTIEVTVVIDFRSKAQPLIEKTFTILEKSTVFDAQPFQWSLQASSVWIILSKR
jgi:hypothetical protein